MPYMTEAMLAADEGVPLALIDRAAVEFGMPMGPIELADTVGLDVASHVGRILWKAFGLPVPRGTAELIAVVNVGRKSGRGYETSSCRTANRSSLRRKAAPRRTTAAVLQHPQPGRRMPARERRRGRGPARRDDLRHRVRAIPGGPLHDARARGVPAIVVCLEELLGHARSAFFRPDAGWSTFGKPPVRL